MYQQQQTFPPVCMLCFVLTVRLYFFIKVYRYPEGFCNRRVATFFEKSVLKETHFLRFLYNSSTTVIQS